MQMPAAAPYVIVGAGFAGLAAARHLHRAGRDFVVVEARDRIGGRTRTETLACGLRLDVGGQFIGPLQKRVCALVSELSVPTFDTYDQGLNWVEDSGQRSSYRGTIPSLPGIGGKLAIANVGYLMWKLNRLAGIVNLEAPWLTPQATELDARTLASWVEAYAPMGAARRLVNAGLKVVFAADLDQISLLHALFYIRSAGDLNQLLAVRNAAQATRFLKGTEDLAQRVMEPFKDRVILSHPVTGLEQDETGVSVHAGGAVIRAQRVIVTLPPPLAAKLPCTPAQPDDRLRLLKHMPMGSVVKCMAVYEKPFWRDTGHSGQAVSTSDTISAVFDSSVQDDPRGVLLGFSVGSGAERLRHVSQNERRAAAMDCFARFFGEAARSPIDYVDHIWTDDPWSRGCYSAIMPPGLWTTEGAGLRRPHGRIHWAGTETATEWNGYIDGAIQSGERAAREVCEA